MGDRQAWRVAVALVGLLLGGFDWPGEVAARARELEVMSTGERVGLMRWLAVAPAAEAEPFVLRGLSDGALEVRVAAARAAGRLHLTAARSALVDGLVASEPEVRRAFATALSHVGGRGSAGALRRALRDTAPSVRAAAARGLSRLDDPEILTALLAQLDDPDTQVRLSAVRAIARLGDPSSVLPLLRRVSDPVVEVRVAVLRALGTLGADSALHLYAEALDDPSTEVRLAALYALGESGAESGLELLRARLSDPEPRVARAAFVALGGLPGEAALQALLARSREPRFHPVAPDVLARALRTPERRERAGVLLAEILATERHAGVAAVWVAMARRAGLTPAHPIVRDALLAQLGDGVLPDHTLIEALSGTRDPETCRSVLELTVRPDPDPERDATLAEALSPCAAQAGGLYTEALLGWLPRVDAATAPRVMELLVEASAVRAAPQLLPYLSSPAAEVRRAALWALAELGYGGSVDPILAALDDPVDTVRLAAGESLGKLAGPTAIDTVLARIEARPEGPHSAALLALRGLLDRCPELTPARTARVLDALGRAITFGADEAAAARAIAAAVAWDPEAARQLVTGIDRSYRRVRRIAAVHALGQLPAAAARAALTPLVGDPDVAVAAAAMAQLAFHADAGDLAFLRRQIEDAPWPVGPNAAFAVARLSLAGSFSPPPVDALCELARAHEPHSSANGIAALPRDAARCMPAAVLRAFRAAGDVRGRAARQLDDPREPLTRGPERLAGDGGGTVTPATQGAVAREADTWAAVQYRDGSVVIVHPDALGQLGVSLDDTLAVESPWSAHFWPR